MTGLGLTLFGHGLYMGAKAQLAQALLSKTWAHTLKTGKFTPPWSSLDAYPIAKIGFPYQKKSAIVLSTDSGQALAFGPGLVNDAQSGGSLVIAAHKNTHFKPLKTLQPGNIVTLETVTNKTSYTVTDHAIIDTRSDNLTLPALQTHQTTQRPQNLVLVTCYPFDNISFNGPLRYVVYAKAVTSS